MKKTLLVCILLLLTTKFCYAAGKEAPLVTGLMAPDKTHALVAAIDKKGMLYLIVYEGCRFFDGSYSCVFPMEHTVAEVKQRMYKSIRSANSKTQISLSMTYHNKPDNSYRRVEIRPYSDGQLLLTFCQSRSKDRVIDGNEPTIMYLIDEEDIAFLFEDPMRYEDIITE